MGCVLDLIVRGGRLATLPGAPLRDVGVAGGLIVAVAMQLGDPASEEIDASGLHVLAGGVDPHVHLNDPGRADWEGFAHGTSRARGGWRHDVHRHAAERIAADGRCATASTSSSQPAAARRRSTSRCGAG